MRIIGIDSSGPVAGVAIVEDEKLIAEYNVEYEKKHSTTLLPMLDEITKMVNFDINTADAIAVTSGPGSFTGIRIGGAMAKGLAYGIGKPIVPVPTLSALAYNFYDAPGIICPIMDARRQQVYNAFFKYENHHLVNVTGPRAIPIVDVIAELEELWTCKNTNYVSGICQDEKLERTGNLDTQVIFLGDGVPVYKDIIEEKMTVPFTFAPANLNRQKASSVAALGALMYAEGKVVDADDFRPDYLRKSQAEQQKERGELL